MTDYAGRTQEHLLVAEQVAQAGRARLRAAKSHQLLLKQRRRAVRRAQWSNAARVAKKRSGQLLGELARHRFSWTGLLFGQVLAGAVVGLSLVQFSVQPDSPAVSNVKPSSVAATGQIAIESSPATTQPAVSAATAQVVTDQCRDLALTQLYPSDQEDGVALRFSPTLTPLSSTLPQESTP